MENKDFKKMNLESFLKLKTANGKKLYQLIVENDGTLNFKNKKIETYLIKKVLLIPDDKKNEEVIKKVITALKDILKIGKVEIVEATDDYISFSSL